MKRALPWLAGIAAFLALTGPVLDPAVQLFYRDTGRLYYPVKKYLAERLLHGHLPLWDPWTEAGTSILGQMSPGLLHPWTLLYLAFPFDLAFKLNHLLPLLLAGAGAYLLARRLGASTWAAVAGGIIYGGCGYLVSQAASNLIFVVGPAGIPLAVERFLAFLERPSRLGLLIASGLLALCIYGGEPQSVLFAGLIGGAMSLQNGKRAAWTLAWGALALLLSAPAALPAADKLSRSKRAQGLSAWERERFFVPPQRWAGMLVAGAFDDDEPGFDVGEQPSEAHPKSLPATPFEEYFAGGDRNAFSISIYLGAPALLLALFAAARRRGRLLLLGALVCVLAAAGEELGLQQLLSATVPGFALFRYAEKLMAPASLLIALAAALGADEAFASRRRAALLAAAAGALALLFGLALLSTRAPGFAEWLAMAGVRHDPATPRIFLERLWPMLREEALLSLLLAAIAAVAALRTQVPSLPLSAVVCAASLSLGSGPILATIPVEHFHVPPPLAKALTDDSGPSEGRWRLYVHPSMSFGPAFMDPKSFDATVARHALRQEYETLYGIEGVGDYFSMVDPHYGTVVEKAPQAMFKLLQVRFFVAMPNYLSEKHAKEDGFARTVQGMWLLTLPIWPRALVLDSAEVSGTPDEAARRLLAPGFDPLRRALLQPAAADLAAAVKPVTGEPGHAALRRLSAERISVEVSAASTSLLEVSEHYDPGWSARLDGAPARVVELDYALLGVPVPAGAHRVELVFWPRGFAAGLICALLALLGTLLTTPVGPLTTFVTEKSTEPRRNA